MVPLVTKHSVAKAVLGNPELGANTPETKKHNISTLKLMLDRYRMVYLKPDSGTGGNGIIRVEKRGRQYEYQLGTTAKTYSSFESLADCIGKNTRNTPYVVQRGIHLLRHNGRLFDLRVMVQKNPRGEWETTGVIGRLGHPRKIVTNVCRGGVSIPAETLLKKHVSDVPDYIRSLRLLGVKTARQLNKTFPRLKELGLDIGIDSNLSPWLLEANPRPVIYGFKTLKDQRIYEKIRRYHESYGY
jgi:hypothetical protein